MSDSHPLALDWHRQGVVLWLLMVAGVHSVLGDDSQFWGAQLELELAQLGSEPVRAQKNGWGSLVQ